MTYTEGYSWDALRLAKKTFTTVFLLLYRDVQELLFKRGVNISLETVRVWCAKFGPDLAEALRQREPRRGRT